MENLIFCAVNQGEFCANPSKSINLIPLKMSDNLRLFHIFRPKHKPINPSKFI